MASLRGWCEVGRRVRTVHRVDSPGGTIRELLEAWSRQRAGLEEQPGGQSGWILDGGGGGVWIAEGS